MLTGLRIGNFKSFGSPAGIAISPLTLLCGANSSGKSTILQALLLLSQSCSGRFAGHPIQLNGFLVELGLFDELVFRGENRKISLGLDVKVPVDGEDSAESIQNRLRIHRGHPGFEASFDIEFSRGDSQPGHGASPRLDFARLVAKSSLGDAAELTVQRRRGRPPMRHLPAAAVPPTVLSNHDYQIQQTVHARPQADDLSLGLFPYEPLVHGELGVELRGMVPQFIWSAYDPVSRQVSRSLRQALRVPSAARPTLDQLAEAGLWSVVTQFWSEPPVRDVLGDVPSSPEKAADQLRLLRLGARQHAQSLLASFAARYERRANEVLAYERTPMPALLELASDALLTELREVRHLGPLREPPRAFHSLPTSGDPLSVGPAGEYTAAVLTRLAAEKVKFRFENEDVEEPLESAVNRWLAFLGVHSGARATELGKIGHFVGVTDEALPNYLDLTQVGVGVSQLLPVLVQCLVAPIGSTVVLEQPELHLHPAVQSRLAHFLLGTSRPGRVIFCETHSEYLISRLRILIARGSVSYGQDVRVFFTDRFQGQSKVEEVPLGPGTSLVHWPSGFFDQSIEDASELVAAQLER